MLWRLIPLLKASGTIQMAIDHWLLEQHRQELSPPILRFYLWSPPALSLGYHQHHYPQDWQHLTWEEAPLSLVRRPTGGRAVLHQGDLTYAVITSSVGGSRRQDYAQLCEFLIQGWRSLGVELCFGQVQRGNPSQVNCFSTATAADLVLPNGLKFIGSAQLKRGTALLQHGSMRLDPDPILDAQVFGRSLSQSQQEAQEIRSEMGAIGIPQIMTALIDAATHCFNAEFWVQPLTPEEWQAIETSNFQYL